jgi:hypothetical protein
MGVSHSLSPECHAVRDRNVASDASKSARDLNAYGLRPTRHIRRSEGPVRCTTTDGPWFTAQFVRALTTALMVR